MKVVKIFFITLGFIILLLIISEIISNLYPKTISRGIFKLVFTAGYYFSEKVEYSDITYKGDTLEILVKEKKHFNHNNQDPSKFLNEINDGSNILIAMDLVYIRFILIDSLGVSNTWGTKL